MQQEISIVNNQVCVKLSGSMYESDAATMKEALCRYVEKGQASVYIDFSAVDYIDSAGLGALVTIQKRSRASGGEVVIHGLQGLVKDLFVLTRVDRVFTIE